MFRFSLSACGWSLNLLVLLFSSNFNQSLLVAAQQCRLIANNAASNLSTGTSVSPDNPFPTSSGSSNSSTTGSSNITSTNITEFQPFNYGHDIVRGVNLGGWFVLEPWITPSIFENTNNDDIVDEYTFGQLQNITLAQQTLKNHWATWITEDDFKAIKAANLNHVRIPLGYWSVPTNESVAPFIPGAWPYLLQALNWARANSIHVILDLHGAPGSQNGYDNSGQRTSDPVWAQNPANISRTLDVLSFIGSQIGGMVDIIELLNEPAGYLSTDVANTIRQFWQDGYTTVRQAAGGNVSIMIEDAFLGVQSWQNFLTYPTAENVLMDNHQYQIFSDDELARNWTEHISFACSLIPGLSSFAASNLWTVMGEWSAAPTDCALWLNGRGVGARWDGSYSSGPGTQVFGSCEGLTGDSANFSTDYKTFLRQYWEAQADIGESIQGWIWWAWKTESADEWSYQKGLAGGWIPQDPTERLYPGQCSDQQ